MKFKTGIFPFVFPKHIFAEIGEGEPKSNSFFGYKAYDHFVRKPGPVVNGEITYFDIVNQRKIWQLSFTFFFFFVDVRFNRQKQL